MVNHEIRGEYSVPVYYEDTDFSGYVYHANYLKYCERAREHLIGLNWIRELFRDDLHFVVRRAEIDFLVPASHGDQITVKTRCIFSRSPLLKFEQDIFKKASNQDEAKCASVKLDVVFVGKGGKPQRLSRDVLAHLESLA